MNTRFIRYSLAVLALMGACGCASYQIRPDAASVQVAKATNPIPATVGITQVEQKVSGGFPDLVSSIKKSLDESRLFKTVLYPTRSGDQLDGGFELRISAKFKADGGLFGKAFITGFFMFLPAPLVVYKHEYQSECTIDLVKDGKKLKTYSANGTVSASHKLFAPADKLEAEGTEASAKLLGAKLVEQLMADRSFLEKELVAPANQTDK